MGKAKKTKEEWLSLFKSVHGERYSYSFPEVFNSRSKIKMVCSLHGEFEQNPNQHVYRKYGCRKCGNIISGQSKKKTLEYYLPKFKDSLGDKYDFSKFIYQGNQIKGEVICPEHGSFFSTPNNLVTGCGCPKCARRLVGDKNEIPYSSCVDKIKENQGLKYVMDESTYKGTSKPMTFYCNEHGKFEQKPIYLITTEYGCPDCFKNQSLGEKKVEQVLIELNQFYSNQHRIKECKNKYPLPFDFAVFKDKDKTNLKCLIEFDGAQHFIPVSFINGANQQQKEENLLGNQARDAIKTNYCKVNNIPLIRIRFNQTNIREILEKELFT